MASFGGAVQSFREALEGVDFGTFTGAQCAALVTELAQVRKACEAAEATLAARAATVGAHRQAGHASPSEWLAAVSGTTAHAARVALDTVNGLEGYPTTRDAAMSGRISLGQAHEIAVTEAIAPGSEAELVDIASKSGLRRVREVGRDIRLSAMHPDELRARQRDARSVITWTDELGMSCGRWRLLPEDGAALVKRLEAETKRHRRATRSVEPNEALAADAFVALMKSSGSAKGPRADVVLVCDVAAWLRGHAHDGEIAKLVGGSPLPVSAIRELSANAFFNVVLHDGVQVQTVAHYGRSIPAHVQTALDIGFPPGFDGPRCREEHCDRIHHLERDHRDPVANGGITNASNLGWLCTPEHGEKTKRDRAAGKLGGRSP